MHQTDLRTELVRLPPETPFSAALQPIPDLARFAVSLRGPLMQVEWGCDATERADEWRHDNGYFLTTPRKSALELDSDHLHEHRNFSADYMLPSDLDLWCLLVSNTHKGSDIRGSRDEQLGLVLKAVPGIPGRFRRVGTFEHKFQSGCEACKLFPENTPVVETEIV